MEIALLIAEALKFIFPAYCANAAPVLAGGGRPIDFGKKFFDDRPVFGKNKTFRGFFFGLFIGASVGYLETVIFGYHPLLGVLTSLGALLGDLAGAFLKRRLGIAPGGLLPVVDQVDFVIGAVLFALPLSMHIMSLELALAIVIITPPLHLLMNLVAYKLRLKNNPW
jgi:CDP-2,3-bis-(O-geranylgeranyl)-sn-glycerol synthase